MKDLTVIVPVYNEEASVAELMQRIHAVLEKANISYEVIFVDDNSKDNTQNEIKKLAKKYPIRLHIKKGKQGKAYSILEGSRLAKSHFIAMIDGDLQYPPEKLPEMLALAQEHGVVVANRKTQETSFLRKFGSKVNAFLFGRFLLGLNCDTQSGLKIFHKEIIDNLEETDVTPWTLDMPLLHTALELGFTIGTVDMHFAERTTGESKVQFIKASKEIALGAVKLRLKQKKLYHIHPHSNESMIGAGIVHKRTRFITHTSLSHNKSALKTFTTWQKLFFLSLILFVLIGLVTNPVFTAITVTAVLSLIYFIDVVFGAYVLVKSLHFPPELKFSDEEINALDEKTLPVYSILCPLYKEAHVLPHFVDSINALDWPQDKLDVLLLLEENDPETVAAAKKMNLPDQFRIVVVPDSQPKTKPKACNYGLNLAKGEYVVIYDAEDKPDPKQLKKTFLGFQKVGPRVFCLQSKLNYYNPNFNWLTRLFTAEYSLWFDVILPGLQSIEATIPLGGTSNHFRTADLKLLEGWDPFNVTEDCDLGIRLFKNGYKTAIVDSTTLEEANSNVRNWIRQRSRWIKGYFQTYLVHMRNPIEFFRRQGLQALIFQLVIGMRMTFMLINPFLWIMTLSYFTLYQYVGPAIESIYPTIVFYLAAFSLAFGNFMYIYNYMIGCAKRDHWSVIKFVFLIPFYWVITSVAAFMALYQLIVKPHYWEKTNHGLHLKKKEEKKLAEVTAETLGVPVSDISSTRKFAIRPYIGAAFLIGANVAANFSNFLYNAYLGREVSIEEFGLVSLISSFFYLSGIITSSIGSTVTHRSAYLLGKYEYPVKEFWMSIRKRIIIVSLGLSLLWLILVPTLTGFFNETNIFPFLLFTPIWLVGLLQAVDQGFLSGSLKFTELAFIAVSEAGTKLGLTYFFIEAGLTSWVYVAIPVSIIVSALVSWIIASRIRYKPFIGPVKAVKKFPKAFFAMSALNRVSTIAFLSLDIVLVKHFLSSREAGEYSLLSLTGKMVFFLGMLFAQFINPLVSKAEGENKESQKVFYQILSATLGAVLLAYLGVGLFGEYTIPFLLGSKANAIVPLLPLYTGGIAAFTIATSVVAYHMVRKHYLLPFIGFIFAIIEIVSINLYHNGLTDVVKTISILSITYLLTVFMTHFLYGGIVIVGNNILDFLGLFSKLKAKPQATKEHLRILIFNWRDTKHVWAGGAEVYVHEIAKRWVDEGHKVTLFCGNDSHSPRNEVVDGVQIVRRGGLYTVYMWAFLYYILKFRGLFDVVVESASGVPFFTPLYVGVPKFLVMHHVHQGVFQKYLPLPLALLARFIEGKVTPIIYRNQKFITISDSSKKDFVKIGLTTEDEVSVVSPGVTLSDYKKSKKTTYPSFIYLGRLKNYKNIDVLVKAFSKIAPKIKSAKLIIAGDGEEYDNLKNLIVNLGIESKVEMLGKISEKQKIKLLGESWVAIQPSSFEGWGITVIEANACGTTVIASNVNGLKDSVVDGKTGILVPAGDVEILAKTMGTVVSSPEFLTDLSKEAYIWSKNFDWDKSAKEFMRIINTSNSRNDYFLAPAELTVEEKI